MIGVSLLLAAALGPAPQVKTGEDVIRAMHARYDGKWYRTLTFVQRAIFTDGRPEEEWWEAALIPGRLRIDIAPVDSGRTMIYRGDSTFAFAKGKLARAAAGRNILAILGFDVYAQAPEKTIELIKAEGFDLTVLKEETWQGKAAYLVGAAPRQFWIEKDRLLFLRVVEPTPDGATLDITFNKYQKLGNGWIGTDVLFLRNGKQFFHEIYRDWKINPAVTDELFDGATWKRAAWIPKQ